jgi:hypothetical protein
MLNIFSYTCWLFAYPLWKNTSNKNKNKQVGLHHTTRILRSEETINQMKEKNRYGMEENICKPFLIRSVSLGKQTVCFSVFTPQQSTQMTSVT